MCMTDLYICASQMTLTHLDKKKHMHVSRVASSAQAKYKITQIERNKISVLSAQEWNEYYKLCDFKFKDDFLGFETK